jgi:hypothetical protein
MVRAGRIRVDVWSDEPSARGAQLYWVEKGAQGQGLVAGLVDTGSCRDLTSAKYKAGVFLWASTSDQAVGMSAATRIAEATGLDAVQIRALKCRNSWLVPTTQTSSCTASKLVAQFAPDTPEHLVAPLVEYIRVEKLPELETLRRETTAARRTSNAQ